MSDSAADKQYSGLEKMDAAADIVGKIAHDFNNLLTPMLAYPHLIRDMIPDDPQARGLLDVLEKTARDMLHITRQLLLLAARAPGDREVIDLSAVVEHVVSEVTQGLIPGDLQVEFEPGEDLPKVFGSSAHLHHALSSVLRNGLEAMTDAEGGTLQVSMAYVEQEARQGMCGGHLEAGGYLRVRIQDCGSGIPEEVQDRVFEPFVSTKRTAERRGAGLGLSIACRVIADHGGCMDFETGLGGTMVSVYLPAVADSSERAVEPEESANEPLTRLAPVPAPVSARAVARTPGTALGSLILIVDDEKTILRLFQMILSTAIQGYKIELAGNGAEAVERFSEKRHGVIVMDLHMPVMDGQAAFHEIRRLCKEEGWEEPSVVFCTGFAPSESLKETVAQDSRHCLLSKPVNGERLVNEVKARLPSG